MATKRAYRIEIWCCDQVLTFLNGFIVGTMLSISESSGLVLPFLWEGVPGASFLQSAKILRFVKQQAGPGDPIQTFKLAGATGVECQKAAPAISGGKFGK